MKNSLGLTSQRKKKEFAQFLHVHFSIFLTGKRVNRDVKLLRAKEKF